MKTSITANLVARPTAELRADTAHGHRVATATEEVTRLHHDDQGRRDLVLLAIISAIKLSTGSRLLELWNNINKPSAWHSWASSSFLEFLSRIRQQEVPGSALNRVVSRLFLKTSIRTGHIIESREIRTKPLKSLVKWVAYIFSTSISSKAY